MPYRRPGHPWGMMVLAYLLADKDGRTDGRASVAETRAVRMAEMMAGDGQYRRPGHDAGFTLLVDARWPY
jgi:hypothetical protein